MVQLFDKGSGTPFTVDDQVLLEEFAVQAAVAVEQSRAVRDVCELFGVVLEGLVPERSAADREERGTLAAHARAFDALRITQLVSEISRQGPEGRHLCQALLTSVAEYAQGQDGAHAGEES